MEKKLLTHSFKLDVVRKASQPGCWDINEVKIYDGDTFLGSYDRNYPSFTKQTFYPFYLNNRWYALYSRDYTSTRVMLLPEATDLCGEDRNEWGFCPVEYYVPKVRRNSYSFNEEDKLSVMCEADCPEKFEEFNEKDCKDYVKKVEEYYLPFGFVAGCVWGDDSCWKIQYLDLSKLTEGKIERKELFGYLELPFNLDLREAIDFSCAWNEEKGMPCYIGVSSKNYFDFEGKDINNE